LAFVKLLIYKHKDNFHFIKICVLYLKYKVNIFAIIYQMRAILSFKKNTIFIIFLFIFAFACTKKPNLKGFDLATWQKDRGGCQGLRTSQIVELKALKQELKGTSANDIADLFGAPDLHRLSERNQEYYIYFLEKGPHCGSLKPISNSKSVIFRFSAIKIVTEITFQNGSL
jgi:hypothetical protein